MEKVYIVYTINSNLSVNEIQVFSSKSLAQVYAWKYYMDNCFYPDDVQDDWVSLMLDNQIFCEVEGVGQVKAIWIVEHDVIDKMEPSVLLLMDLNKNPEE